MTDLPAVSLMMCRPGLLESLTVTWVSQLLQWLPLEAAQAPARQPPGLRHAWQLAWPPAECSLLLQHASAVHLEPCP